MSTIIVIITSTLHKAKRMVMKATTKATFQQDVLDSKKIVLLDVWAPFCGVCLGLEPTVDKISQEFDEWLDVVKLDASEDMDFVQELDVSSLPTFMVYKKGQPVNQLSGATTKAKIEEMLLKAKAQ